MFRRLISLLVIAGFLAGQLAAVPHSHAGMTPDQQREHDQTPHFHFAWFGEAGHEHAHSHGGHSYGNSTKVPPEGVALCSDCHDADAIYVAPSAAAPTNPVRKFAADQALALAKWTMPPATCPVEPGAKASVFAHWHPPDEVQDASDSYLTLRQLRI